MLEYRIFDKMILIRRWFTIALGEEHQSCVLTPDFAGRMGGSHARDKMDPGVDKGVSTLVSHAHWTSSVDNTKKTT